MVRRPRVRWLLCVVLAVGVMLALPAVGGVTAQTTVEYVLHLEGTDEDGFAALQVHANATQAPVVAELEQLSGVTMTDRFWIANTIIVSVTEGATDPATLKRIEGVEAVHSHEPIEIVPTSVDGASTSTDGVTPGLEQLGIPGVWTAYDTRGGGTSVAVLDTGVDPDHPDIDVAVWKDFHDDPSAEPKDYDRHGTHVAGTVAGGNADGTHIGVAPDADLYVGAVITNCDPQCRGDLSQVLAGMEWAVAEEVDVISLSIGQEGFKPATIEAVENAQAAGTVTVAAVGNVREGSSVSPGNVYGAIGVGAVDEYGNVPSFSGGEIVKTEEAWGEDAIESWPDSYYVPDVVAPGVDVKSAQPGGGYRTASGTSMATPHVAGTVVLGQAATERTLTVDEIAEALRTTATHPDAGPDTRYGHGIVDAEAFLADVTTRASITGSVTDAATGVAIENATVMVASTNGTDETTTDEAGAYRVEGIPSGEYELMIDAPNYEPTTHLVTLEPDDTMTVDVGMTGDGTIEFTLVDGHFGDGIEGAAIDVTGQKGGYPVTEDGDGVYSSIVPSNQAYEFAVSVVGYQSVNESLQLGPGEQRTVERSLAGNAEIALGVTDMARGGAVEAVDVTLLRTDGTRYEADIRSDGAGQAVIQVPGTDEAYRVRGSHPGYHEALTDVMVSDRTSVESALMLTGDSTVVIEVRDETFDSTVTNAEVALSDTIGSIRGDHVGNGVYHVTGVASSRSWDVGLTAPGYTAANDTKHVAGNTTIQGSLRGDTRVTVTSVDAVTEQPIPGTRVNVSREAEKPTVLGRSDLDGTVGVWLPSDGSMYTVRGAVNGYHSARMTIDVTAREEMNVELPLSGDGTVLLTVSDALFYATVDNASVTLEREGSVYRGQGNGEITIESVPSGVRYAMTVDAPGYRSGVDTVDVMKPGTHDHIVPLAGDANVSVHVVDAESDAVIPGAALAVNYVDRPVVADGLETDEQGRITVAVPGTGAGYAITASAAGYASNETVVEPVTSGDHVDAVLRLQQADGMPGMGAGIAMVAIGVVLFGRLWYAQ